MQSHESRQLPAWLIFDVRLRLMDPLFEDLHGMFGFISFSNGKGCYADDISLGDIEERYARHSSTAEIVQFLRHYASLHPDMIEERSHYSEYLPTSCVLFHLKCYEAADSLCDRKKLIALIDAMRPNPA